MDGPRLVCLVEVDAITKGCFQDFEKKNSEGNELLYDKVSLVWRGLDTVGRALTCILCFKYFPLNRIISLIIRFPCVACVFTKRVFTLYKRRFRTTTNPLLQFDTIAGVVMHAHITSNQSGAENDKRVLVREQRVLLLSKNKKALFHLSQSGAEFRIQFSPLPKELVKLKSWAVYHTPLWTRVVILSRCKIVIRWQLNSREGRRALSTG